MSLTLALTERDSSTIGSEELDNLLKGYDAAFPDLQLLADVILMTPDEIQALNREHRTIDEPTDVLSFPTIPNFQSLAAQAKTQPTLIGTIVICPEKAEVYKETLIQLVHHGLLHLLGYDHESDLPAWISEEGRILNILSAHNLIIPPIPYESV